MSTIQNLSFSDFLPSPTFLDFKLRMREKTKRGGEKEKYVRGMLKQVNEEGTPFNKKVLIIDEVHGFISNIVNKIDQKELDRAPLVYSWIMKADNCKLVCLSGTPVVNKPNEMAFDAAFDKDKQ